MSRYCVIGASAAGLSALQQLREAGYEVECFEKTDRVGGPLAHRLRGAAPRPLPT
jgi:predicted NAD/FAD-dependent oxidoreductase